MELRRVTGRLFDGYQQPSGVQMAANAKGLGLVRFISSWKQSRREIFSRLLSG